MKTQHYLAIVSILLLTLASACHKPDPKPEPEPLPTGENTMYYYIDGELFIPKADSNGGIYSYALYYYECSNNSNIQIVANDGILIQFHNGLSNIGTITLNQSDYNDCQVLDNHSYNSKQELGSDGIYHTIWYYTHDESGTVNITFLSEDKKRFIGTFEMTLYHENTNKEIHITEGHFNINIDTLYQ